jgi:hypothetical protein
MGCWQTSQICPIVPDTNTPDMQARALFVLSLGICLHKKTSVAVLAHNRGLRIEPLFYQPVFAPADWGYDMNHQVIYIRQRWRRTLEVLRALGQILKLILAILKIIKEWL